MDTSIKVILLVKSKPELYDVHHPDYGNKRHHTFVWKELANKMCVKVQHLKAKWNSLRNSYARTIRPEILDPNAPEKNWYLKTQMDFLRPHVIHKIKRSKYLEKIRNGDLFEEDSQMIDLNDLDESHDIVADDSNKTNFTINSPIQEDIQSNCCCVNFDIDHVDAENQPIDFLEGGSHGIMTTVHDFTVQDENKQNQQTSPAVIDEQMIKKDIDSSDTQNFFKISEKSTSAITATANNNSIDKNVSANERSSSNLNKKNSNSSDKVSNCEKTEKLLEKSENHDDSLEVNIDTEDNADNFDDIDDRYYYKKSKYKFKKMKKEKTKKI